MNGETPYVSVVIPTFNRSSFVVSAIESVLAQKGSTRPYEIIVIDDGSTDDTEAVLQRYADAIRYYRVGHSGLPARARNVGISEAHGDVVAFLDSDDLWSRDKLARQLGIFDKPSVMLAYSQAQKIHGDDPTPCGHLVEPETLHNGEDFCSLLGENVIPTLTVVARREALLQVGGFDESPELQGVEDYELWLRMAAAFPGAIVSSPASLAFYRVHGEGLGSPDSLRAIKRLLAVYDSVWRRDDLTAEQRTALEAQLVRMHENWGRQAALEGDVPAISVVMSFYRDRAFVADAIQSILGQTFEDFEFIVVDDGSDDGSYDVVTQFTDPRIRVVRGTNHGLVDALNTGIGLARASLIARQDADDISLPERLEREFAWMSANPGCAVVGTFFSYVDERTLERTGVTIMSPTKHLDIVRHMYFDNPIGHGTTVIRRQAVEEVGGYSNTYGPTADFDFWRRIVAAGGEIALLPDVHYLYRLNSSGISSTMQELQHRFFADLIAEIWRGPAQFKSFWEIAADNRYYARLNSPFRQEVSARYKHHQIRLAMEFLDRRYFRCAFHTFVGALLIDPAPAARLASTVICAWAGAAARRARRIRLRR